MNERQEHLQEPAPEHVIAGIVWRVSRDPASGAWMAVSDDAGLNAIGDSWGELVACAEEAVQLVLQDLEDDGELDAWLAEFEANARGSAVRVRLPSGQGRCSLPEPVLLPGTPLSHMVAEARRAGGWRYAREMLRRVRALWRDAEG